MACGHIRLNLQKDIYLLLKNGWWVWIRLTTRGTLVDWLRLRKLAPHFSQSEIKEILTQACTLSRSNKPTLLCFDSLIWWLKLSCAASVGKRKYGVKPVD